MVHNRCPTCRQELGDIRCLALEKVAESLELPCRYNPLGCPEIFPYYSKLKHESLCNFRPYNCPYAGSDCSVVGDIPYLVGHLRDDHKVDMHSGCTFNHRYVKSNPREVENATWMLTVSRINGCRIAIFPFGFHEVVVLMFVFVRSFTVSVSTSVSILKPSSLRWHLFIWHFFVSWGMRQKLGTTPTALRLEETEESLFGKAILEA